MSDSIINSGGTHQLADEERGEMSMEKNRIRPIAAGKNIRMSYSRQKEVLEMPNLIEG